MVGLNQGMVSNAAAPFGGVKASGFGREGGQRGHRGVPGDQVHRDGDVTERPAGHRSATWYRARRGRGRARAGGRGARDRDAGRAPVGADRAAARASTSAGVAFYTNRESRKGRELAANPRAALAVHWQRAPAPGPARGARRGAAGGGVRRVLRVARARQPDRRLGVATQSRAIAGPRVRWRRASPRSRTRYPGDGAAPAALGRLPARPGRDRVLAGPAEPAARARPVPSRG